MKKGPLLPVLVAMIAVQSVLGIAGYLVASSYLPDITKARPVPDITDVTRFKQAPGTETPAPQRQLAREVLFEVPAGAGPYEVGLTTNPELQGQEIYGAIGVDARGTIYVNDPQNQRVLRFDDKGNGLGMIPAATDLGGFLEMVVDPSGFIYGLNVQELAVINPQGEAVCKFTDLNNARILSLVGDGVVLVGDTTPPAEGDNLRFRAVDRNCQVVSTQEQYSWDLNVYKFTSPQGSVSFARAGGTLSGPQYELTVTLPDQSTRAFRFTPERRNENEVFIA